MGKPTVHDIAREAGVSLATVDRVLNERPGVRAITATRVHEAIKKLGYVRDLHAANLARQRHYSFVFVLPDGDSQFLGAMRGAIAEARQGLMADRADLRTLTLPLRDSTATIQSINRLVRARVNGVAIMANETPLVRDMISHLKARGLAVVTLVTDQSESERDWFVGIDNMAAGRTAGRLMGRFVKGAGKVAVIVNTTHARDMIERRMGFDTTIARDAPQLLVLPSLEGRDDRERTAEALRRCLARHPDVMGIYCAGAGSSGVTRVIDEIGLERPPVVIVHELTSHTREALEGGKIDIVINQNVGHLVRSATRVLRAKCDGAPVIASQEKIRIEIVMKENLP